LARLHSTEMARNGYVGHAGPEGDGPTVRAGELGVGCSGHAVGENVLRTYYQRSVETSEGHEIYSTEKELARGIVNQWMDSEGHRRNLLWEGYEREGIGVRITRSGEVYVTQNLC
ncbi:MAG: CAP domain-containing protein, partial [Halobacteria archaeon]|nr:CAP domain-containing protein [Halobacteria archaeon]